MEQNKEKATDLDSCLDVFERAGINPEPRFHFDDEDEVKFTGWYDERSGRVTCFWRRESLNQDKTEWFVVICTKQEITDMSDIEQREFLLDLPASPLKKRGDTSLRTAVKDAVDNLVIKSFRKKEEPAVINKEIDVVVAGYERYIGQVACSSTLQLPAKTA